MGQVSEPALYLEEVIMTMAAKSITRYCKFFRHQGAATVLDYGAGKLRNANYLAEQGFTVFAADLPRQAGLVRDTPAAKLLAGILDSDQLSSSCLNVDLVLSTYVSNRAFRLTGQE